jgi:hypothetical protein
MRSVGKEKGSSLNAIHLSLNIAFSRRKWVNSEIWLASDTSCHLSANLNSASFLKIEGAVFG